MPTEPEWCDRCEKHRVSVKGHLCPVCLDDDDRPAEDQQKAVGWV